MNSTDIISDTNDSDTENTHRIVGITLAIISGFFIGSSFIFKKRGLLDTNAKGFTPGQGHEYLKSPMWWLGMTLMLVGEGANFLAYAFSPAIFVTPLGALSVVISAILSSIFLNEKLNFSGKVGCAQSLFGALIIVFNASGEGTTSTVGEFFYFVIAPGFIVYSIFVSGIIFYLIYYAAPQYGEYHPIVYISICSLVGSYLVLSTQGFGSSVVYTFSHWDDDNQFLDYRLYILLLFVILTVFVQINYLNKALNLFSTAIVTPVYYVFFTTATLLSSAILFRGFPVETPVAGASILIGFLVIVGGVSLLFEYSNKVTKLNGVVKKFHALKPEEISDDDLEQMFRHQNNSSQIVKSEHVVLSAMNGSSDRDRAVTAPAPAKGFIGSNFHESMEFNSPKGRAAMGLMDEYSPKNSKILRNESVNSVETSETNLLSEKNESKYRSLSLQLKNSVKDKKSPSHRRGNTIVSPPKIKLAPVDNAKLNNDLAKIPTVLPPPTNGMKETKDVDADNGYIKVTIDESSGNPW